MAWTLWTGIYMCICYKTHIILKTLTFLFSSVIKLRTESGLKRHYNTSHACISLDVIPNASVQIVQNVQKTSIGALKIVHNSP